MKKWNKEKEKMSTYLRYNSMNSLHHSSVSISTEPGISWTEDNFFNDWDPQIADKAIAIKDAVLKSWSTIGRCELILSLKVVIWEVN